MDIQSIQEDSIDISLRKKHYNKIETWCENVLNPSINVEKNTNLHKKDLGVNDAMSKNIVTPNNKDTNSNHTRNLLKVDGVCTLSQEDYKEHLIPKIKKQTKNVIDA